jgi:hypothetical protein
MSTRTFGASLVTTLLTLAVVGRGTGPSRIAPPVEAASTGQAPVTATLDDQSDLAVTVYNSDLALVRDARNLRLGLGVADLHFMDIAATVNPASVHFPLAARAIAGERARAELRVRPARA